MKIQKNLRTVILIELLLPLALLVFGVYHGVMQVLYRSGLISASKMFGIDYYQGLTAHGVINAIVLTTFFAVALGNAVVSQFLGECVSAAGEWAALALMTVGSVVAAGAIFAGRASVLYTFYPPLMAHWTFYLGLALVIVGSWVAFFCWIPPYLKWRRENPAKKTPMAVVGIFATFIVWQLATLPVAYEDLVMLLPWSLGWTKGVDVVLARTLFWFFGHPLVYFWLLPAYVMYYTVMPGLAGGKLYSDFAGRFSFLMFVALSCPLGLHHQFSDPGIDSSFKALQAVLTMFVAIPSLLTAFTLAASLEFAGRRNGGKGLFGWWRNLPHFDETRWLFPYLFMGLVIFVVGGITGIVNASYTMNSVVHNTAWLPAHFHLTVGGPVLLSILGTSLFLVTGLTGRKVAFPKLAILVPYLWTAGVFTFSAGLFWGGLHGEPRRTNLGLSYLNANSSAYRPDWYVSTHVGVVGGCVMALAFAVFCFVLVASLLGPQQAGAADSFSLPSSEAYHDEDIPAVKNLGPWVVAAVVLILISYAPPLVSIVSAHNPPAVGFHPNDPAPVEP